MLKFWTSVAKIGIPIVVGITTVSIAWLGYFEKKADKRHQEDVAARQADAAFRDTLYDKFTRIERFMLIDSMWKARMDADVRRIEGMR